MKRELNLTNWCKLPVAAAPLCYPPVLFWPRPGLEKCLIFSAFSWSNPTYYQEIWLSHELGDFSCVANFQFSAVSHQAGNLCYRTSWDHRSVLTPRERPPPPPLWGLISFPTYQTYSRLTTHYHPILGHILIAFHAVIVHVLHNQVRG